MAPDTSRVQTKRTVLRPASGLPSCAQTFESVLPDYIAQGTHIQNDRGNESRHHIKDAALTPPLLRKYSSLLHPDIVMRTYPPACEGRFVDNDHFCAMQPWVKYDVYICRLYTCAY